METMREIPEEFHMPGMQLCEVGPPEGRTEEEVYTIQALMCPYKFNETDPDEQPTPMFWMLVKVEDHELEKIKESGGYFWMINLGSIPPHMFGVIEPVSEEEAEANQGLIIPFDKNGRKRDQH